MFSFSWKIWALIFCEFFIHFHFSPCWSVTRQNSTFPLTLLTQLYAMVLKRNEESKNCEEREKKIWNELSSHFLLTHFFYFSVTLSFFIFFDGFLLSSTAPRFHPECCEQSNIFSFNFLLHQVHPCGRYRHNTVVFILAKEYNLKNLRTIHRLDRLTSGLLLFGRSPKKARQMEHQIRNRQVQKQYVCRVEGEFPE